MMISPILAVSAVVVVVLLWQVHRRFKMPGVSIALGLLILASLGARLVVPLVSPAHEAIGWQLAHGYGGPKFDPATAQTTTMIPMIVGWPDCEQGDWLGSPTIDYTPWSVTITMNLTDAFAAKKITGMCLSGKYVQVQLSEPLGGRQLFDGVLSPAVPRS